MGRQPGLAFVHGPAALGWLAFLTGCGSPISNELLEEEAAFLASLPSEARLGAPEGLLLAPEGPDPVLAAGHGAAVRWFGLVEVPITLADALRAQAPDERTTVARRWDPLEVAPLLEGTALGLQGAVTGYARAEILELDDGSYAWTFELAPSADGPWQGAGSGRQLGPLGDQEWDLGAVAEAFGGDASPGWLEISTTDEDPDLGDPREAEGTLRDGARSEPWQLSGLDGIGFAQDLALTDDGLTWPATATVFHTLEVGGIGAGVIQQGTTELAFTACWEAFGQTRSRTGDPGVTPVPGDPCDGAASRGGAPSPSLPAPGARLRRPSRAGSTSR